MAEEQRGSGCRATFEVVVDGNQHMFVAATVVVANSGSYGKGMHPPPTPR